MSAGLLPLAALVPLMVEPLPAQEWALTIRLCSGGTADLPPSRPDHEPAERITQRIAMRAVRASVPTYREDHAPAGQRRQSDMAAPTSSLGGGGSPQLQLGCLTSLTERMPSAALVFSRPPRILRRHQPRGGFWLLLHMRDVARTFCGRARANLVAGPAKRQVSESAVWLALFIFNAGWVICLLIWIFTIGGATNVVVGASA